MAIDVLDRDPRSPAAEGWQRFTFDFSFAQALRIGDRKVRRQAKNALTARLGKCGAIGPGYSIEILMGAETI